MKRCLDLGGRQSIWDFILRSKTNIPNLCIKPFKRPKRIYLRDLNSHTDHIAKMRLLSIVRKEATIGIVMLETRFLRKGVVCLVKTELPKVREIINDQRI